MESGDPHGTILANLTFNEYGNKNIDPTMDQSVIEAYERYVMAQFTKESKEAIEAEKQDAIKSLIPGTKHYYHLYFLDLLKK